MKKRLKSILLVDDSRADTFLHERVIKKTELSEKVLVCSGAREALDMVSKEVDGEIQSPDLILLDINMPNMSGWDFLDEYRKLNEEVKRNSVICMLTTSDAEEDIKKAKSYDLVKGYYNKPLMLDDLMKMVEEV